MLVYIKVESVTKIGDRSLAFETWQAGIEHKCYKMTELFRILSCNKESLYAELLEHLVGLCIC